MNPTGCPTRTRGIQHPYRSHWGYVNGSRVTGHELILGLGTSIGAYVGGLYAREGDIISSAGRTKQFSGRMGNIWRILSDVTYPIVAYTTVSYLNTAMRSRD